MSALMADLIDGRVDHSISKSICQAGSKLLQVIDMEFKYRDRNGKAAEPKTIKMSDEE